VELIFRIYEFDVFLFSITNHLKQKLFYNRPHHCLYSIVQWAKSPKKQSVGVYFLSAELTKTHSWDCPHREYFEEFITTLKKHIHPLPRGLRSSLV